MKNIKIIQHFTALLVVMFLFTPFISRADSLTDYDAQYQAVQAKIQPLEAQYNTLEQQSSSQGCALYTAGIAGRNCELIFQQQSAISQYETAIQKDSITPVTDTSITYENKLDDLNQQIFQIKMNYYQDLNDLIVNNGGQAAQSVIDARSNQLTANANTKITAINQKLQETLSEYQNAIYNERIQQLQQQQQPTCPVNSYLSNNLCFCNNGYAWNAGQTACVAIPPIIINQNINQPTAITQVVDPQQLVVDSQPTQTVTQIKVVTPTYKKNLTLGSKGDDVTALQKLLVSKGLLTWPKGSVYGSFGSLTRTALRKLQAGWKLPVTGILDTKTRSVLNPK